MWTHTHTHTHTLSLSLSLSLMGLLSQQFTVISKRDWDNLPDSYSLCPSLPPLSIAPDAWPQLRVPQADFTVVRALWVTRNHAMLPCWPISKYELQFSCLDSALFLNSFPLCDTIPGRGALILVPCAIVIMPMILSVFQDRNSHLLLANSPKS